MQARRSGGRIRERVCTQRVASAFKAELYEGWGRDGLPLAARGPCRCVAAKLLQIVNSLHTLLILPVVVLVAFEAASFGEFFRGTLRAMALLTGCNTGHKNIRRLVARRCFRVARIARHHAM